MAKTLNQNQRIKFCIKTFNDTMSNLTDLLLPHLWTLFPPLLSSGVKLGGKQQSSNSELSHNPYLHLQMKNISKLIAEAYI